MRQALGPYVERGSRWLQRRGNEDAGARLKRFAFEPGRERVVIDDLVSPLRYDVVFREMFFAFVRANRPLADDDFPAFLELARDQPHYSWFTRVAIPEFRPEWGDEPERWHEHRVRRTVAIHDDLAANGYDPRRPIVLRTGVGEIAPTATGKRVSTRLFAGDGCHRIAWLSAAGVTTLEPHEYRLQRTRDFIPRDLTTAVLDTLEIGPAEYFAFLSRAYADGRCETEADLLERVGASTPQRLAEVQALIAIDRPRLADETRY
jgi:hypothetical protein